MKKIKIKNPDARSGSRPKSVGNKLLIIKTKLETKLKELNQMIKKIKTELMEIIKRINQPLQTSPCQGRQMDSPLSRGIKGVLRRRKFFKIIFSAKTLKNISVSVFIFIMILGQLVSPSVAEAATFTMYQTAWNSVNASEAHNPTGGQTTITTYSAKDTNLDLADSGTNLKLSTTGGTDTDTLTAEFNGTTSQTTVASDSVSLALTTSTAGTMTQTDNTATLATPSQQGGWAVANSVFSSTQQNGTTGNGASVKLNRNSGATVTSSFAYTGGQQSWVVPSDISSITVDLAGARGGGAYYGTTGLGGNGGRVIATFSVTSGNTLYVYAGGAGGDATSSVQGAAGYNGGGIGGNSNYAYKGGGGGGASDIRVGGTALANRVVVAAGAGGGGSNGQYSALGGGGGGSTGITGADGADPTYHGHGGTGGTQSAGGSGGAKGASGAGLAGSAGSLGLGGDTNYITGSYGAGGGGAGYYGGGGGGSGEGGGGGGGGGSSYCSSGCTSNTSNYQNNNGYANISYNAYYSSGTYTSYVDSAQTTPVWNNFNFTKGHAEGSGSNSIRVQVKSSSSSSTAPTFDATGNCDVTVTADGTTSNYDISSCTGGGVGSGRYLWHKTTLNASTDLTTTPTLDQFVTTTRVSYQSSGSYQSLITNTGQPNYSWGNLTWTKAGTGTVGMRARTCNDSACAGETAIDSCTLFATSPANISSDTTCVHTGDQWIQYKAYYTGGDTVNPLSLNDVTANWNYYPTNQTLTSPKYDSGASATQLGGIQWNEDNGTLPTGTTVTFSLKTASSAGGLDSATYYNFTNADCNTPVSKSGTLVTCTTANLASKSSTLTDGVNDQFLQYKVTLGSTGANTPTFSDSTITYVRNSPPEVQSVTASQSSNGTVTVDYQVRDGDTSTGATQGKVAVTLQYCTANCSSAGSETWTNAVTVADVSPDHGVGSNVTVNTDNTTYTTHHILWTPKTDYNGIYNNTNFKIRVKADDGEAASQYGYGQSSTFTLDTTNPTGTLVLDANLGTATLTGTDNSAITYLLQNGSSVTSGTSATATSNPWTFGSETNKTVTAKLSDPYGNQTSVTAVAPAIPLNFQVRDLTNSQAQVYGEALSWSKVTDVTGSTATGYQIWRSDNGGTLTLLTTVDDLVNSYSDLTVAYNHVYAYKVLAVDADGDISGFSGSQTNTAGVATTPPTITLNGANPMTVTKGATFTDPGATATDTIDITDQVTVTGTVDANTVNTYTLTYTATNSSGLTSVMTRAVNVVLANTYNVVATAGANGTVTPTGTTAVASGASRTYTISPDEGYAIATLTVDGVSLATATSYTFSNVVATHTIAATFRDITAPVITLNGANPMSVTKNSTFTDPGATALDAVDGTTTVNVTGTVNTAVVGSYTLTYSSTDQLGNTGTAPRTVNVVLATTYDITASAGANGTVTPSDTTSVVSGQNQIYTITPDAGYSVSTLTVDGVNVAPATSYTFMEVVANHTINVTFSKNADTTPPVITLNGINPMSVTKNSTFTDPGATALDATDGTTTVNVTGTVNTAAVGSYVLTYSSTDSASNTTLLTRTVNVVLASTYNITATSGSHGTVTPSGTTAVTSGANQMYTITPDEGYAIATLTVDGASLAPTTSYTFSNVTVAHTIAATFSLNDVVAPVITLNGANPMSVTRGGTYTEPGATALDAVDGSRTVLVSGTVNTAALGAYVITYTATDLAGNIGTTTRTVNVVLATTYNIVATTGANGTVTPSGTTAVASGANQMYAITPDEGYAIATLTVDGASLTPASSYTFMDVSTTHTISATFTNTPDVTPPVITLVGANPMDVVLSSTFADPGATALDDIDGDITSSIVATGTVNANAIGIYTVTYNVSDTANNKATTITRTVNVKYADTYNITASATGNGTIVPTGTNSTTNGVTSVPAQTDQVYTITPDDKYKISSLVVDSVNLEINTTYTFTNVIASHTISVTFAPLDSLPPVITLNEPDQNPMNINSGTEFVDPGATAVDAVTSEPVDVVATGTVDTSTGGVYTITYTATDTNSNVSTATRTVNVADVTSPVITLPAEPSIIMPTQAVITWTTNEDATGQVVYGKVSCIADPSACLESEQIIVPAQWHLIVLSGLDVRTPYYYSVTSIDKDNNPATSDEQTFTTIAKSSSSSTTMGVAQDVYDALLAQNKAYSAKFGSDTSIPIVADVKVSDITPFNATVSFTTSKDTIAYINYGKDTSYGMLAADDNMTKSHTIKINGLTLGTEYNFKVKVVDTLSNAGYSENQTFTTKFLMENLADAQKIDNVEQFQKEIEATIQSILPSLVPPFIDTPTVTDITENSATINFRTNVKSYPIVDYVTDGSYDATKDDPYDGEVSDVTKKTIDHTIILNNLKSNTKYHVMTKAFSLAQVIGKSADFTFTTAASKIQASVIGVKKDAFTVVWNTDEPTSSIVEYKDLKTGIVNRVVDSVSDNSHSVNITGLTPGTSYEVNVSGIDAKGNTIESGAPVNVRTSVDVTPPVISNLKVDSSLIVGLADKVQTIISWQTDEPSTSVVNYAEGPGSVNAPLTNRQERLEYSLNHVVILTSLKAGTVYRFTVESTDGAGNTVKPPVRTIVTPQQSASIMDIIFKNFDDTFKFINNIK